MKKTWRSDLESDFLKIFTTLKLTDKLNWNICFTNIHFKENGVW